MYLKKVLAILILLALSLNASAGDLKVVNGHLSYPIDEKFNQNGFRAWKRLDGGGITHEYNSTFDKSLKVSGSLGQRSASTVPATIEASVSRAAVLDGAFALVKGGARLALRGAGYVGAAYMAYEAYQAVKSSLESQGYHYDDEKEEFVKDWDNANCIRYIDYLDPAQPWRTASCFGVDSSTIEAYKKGGREQEEAKWLMQQKMRSLAEPFWEVKKEELCSVSISSCSPGTVNWRNYVVDSCEFDLNGGSCTVVYNGDIRNVVSFSLRKSTDATVLSKEEFLNIATPIIDSNPTPFVEGAEYPQQSTNVVVPNGTIAQTTPYTNPQTGKAEQTTWTFNTTNNITNVTTVVNQRPDLSDNSSEAPKVEKNKDETTDMSTGTDSATEIKQSGSQQEKPKEESSLCNLFPNILACADVGNVEEKDNPFSIVNIQDDTTFTQDLFMPDNGQCPAPVSANYLGIELQFKYDFICQLAEKIRFLLIGLAAVVAGYIMFGTRKD